MHSETLLSLFLPVLPTLLRGYCFAVRQNDMQLERRCRIFLI